MRRIILFCYLCSIICSCNIFKYSDTLQLSNALIKKEVNDNISKDSRNTAEAYNRIEGNAKIAQKLYKFDEGCYLIKIKNDIISIPPPSKNRKIRDDSVLITNHTTDNNLDLTVADKLMYLTFIDNERLFFHSPYQTNFIKSGQFGRVKPKTLNGKIRTKAYVRNTNSYFKLGFNFEFNSVKRGYYKFDNNGQLNVWLETYFEKKKIVLTQLKFKTEIVDNKIETLKLVDNATFRDKHIPIEKTFEEDFKIDFDYLNKPMRLLLVRKNVCNCKNQHLNKEKIDIITKIEVKGDSTFYTSINQYDCSNDVCTKQQQRIVEIKKDKFTF